MIRSVVRCHVLAPLFVLTFLPASRSAGQDWSRYDEAASIVGVRDTAMVLDLARLERVRSALERSRAAFPELAGLRADGPGTAVWLMGQYPPGDEEALRRALSSAPPSSRRAGATWLISTAIRSLDSLNVHFAASGVVIPDSIGSHTNDALMLRVEFPRPMNIWRIEPAYDAAGYYTLAVFRGIGPRDRSWIVWEPGEDSDILQFSRESDCLDPCRRHERYRVRIPHALSRRPAMILRSDRRDPSR